MDVDNAGVRCSSSSSRRIRSRLQPSAAWAGLHLRFMSPWNMNWIGRGGVPFRGSSKAMSSARPDAL